MDKSKVDTMKSWVRRRRDKGVEPSADVIWDRIKEKWPNLPQEQWEAIFQRVK